MQEKPPCSLKLTQTVKWHPDTCSITVECIDIHCQYLLITTSLRSEFHSTIQNYNCSQCLEQHTILTYQLQTNNPSSHHQQSGKISLQFCILVLGTDHQFLHSLGTAQRQYSFIGNLVARPIFSNSQKKTIQRQPQIQHPHFKSLMSPQEQIVKSNEEGEKECELYVTKLQKEVSNFHRATMFHEYIWTEEEIEFLMKEVRLSFGEYVSVVQKRKYLKFTYRRSQQDQEFWIKWEGWGRDLFFQKQKIIQDKLINFYIVSKECLLSREELTNRLFQLPSNVQIVDMCLTDPWVIIAGQSYLLFLHNYKPMELFKHLDKIRPIKIILGSNKSMVAIPTKECIIICFRLYEHQVIKQRVFQTPFLIPYCLAQRNRKLFLAGIDIQFKGTLKVAGGVRKNLPTLWQYNRRFSSQTTTFLRNQSFHCSFPYKRENPTSYELLACSCQSAFFLFSFQGQKLIQVQLKSHIKLLQYISFPFNLFNFIIRTEQGELIRLGIEQYGTTLGSELQRLQTGEVSTTSIACKKQYKHCLFISEGNKIRTVNCLKDKYDIFLEQQKPIAMMSSDQSGMAYLIDLNNLYQLKYLEI